MVDRPVDEKVWNICIKCCNFAYFKCLCYVL